MGSRHLSLVGTFEPAEWMQAAACADLPAGAMFPTTHADQKQAAERHCSACPVAHACLDYALTRRIDHGVWGAATEKDRRRILKRRRLEAAASG